MSSYIVTDFQLSIEEGKLADMIAVKGNPLDDISILENIEVIIKDGVVY